MSDSDDDVPIFHRRPAAAAPPPASAPASAPTAVSARVAEAAVKPAQDAVQKPAAVKKEVESDSDDDVPIAQRSKPAGTKPVGDPKPASASADTKVDKVAATPTVTAEVKVKTESKEHKAHDGHHKHKHDHHHKHHHKAEHKHGHKHSYAKADKDKPAVKQEAKVKREKKEYDMPGQTRDTPAENDSLRKFYTTLLEQNPDSEMAKRWCVIHGLLSREEAEEWVAVNKGKTNNRTPVKAANGHSNGATPPRRGASAAANGNTRAKPAVKKEANKAAAKAQLKPKAPPKGVNKRDMIMAEDDSDSDDDLPLAKRARV
eukprot:jgi/Chrzof1/10415/UNPLg00339.t1